MLSVSKNWWRFLYRQTFNDVYWQGDPHCEILVNRVADPAVFSVGFGSVNSDRSDLVLLKIIIFIKTFFDKSYICN